MDTYHKINALYKRHTEGKRKGKLITGDWAVPELGYLAKNPWEFTEKVDGTNIRVGFELDRELLYVNFGGRSDNAQIPKPLLWALDGMFADGTATDKVKAWMMDNNLTNVTLYGEGYGPKIQKGGGNYRDDVSFVLFDVKVGDFWLDRDNVNDVATKLGIDSVPVLGVGTLLDAVDIVTLGFGPGPDGRLKSFSGSLKRGLQSAWGEFEAEGIVARPVVPLFNRKGERIITKIKGVDFK